MLILKLSEVIDGSVILIRSVGGSEDIKRRIYELKLLPHTKLIVVKNNKGSYVVVETDNGKFGIPFDLAENIEVEVVGVSVLK